MLVCEVYEEIETIRGLVEGAAKVAEEMTPVVRGKAIGPLAARALVVVLDHPTRHVSIALPALEDLCGALVHFIRWWYSQGKEELRCTHTLRFS